MPTLDLGDLEEVDYDPFKRRGLLDQSQLAPDAPQPDLTAAARAGQLGTLSAGDPSWGNKLAGGFSNTMGLLGATPEGQRNAYEFGQDLTQVVPGVSNIVSANDAYRDYQSGDYLGSVLNAAGALPLPGLKAETTAARDFGKELKAFGPAWKKAPVIDASGNVVHGAITADKTIGGPLGILDEQGNLNKGLLSYHGSSADWDKVDLNKIGTGEGTVDEGWGFYSATHPKVADYYKTLGDPTLVDSAGNAVPLESASDYIANNALQSKGGNYDKAIAHTSKGVRWDPTPKQQQLWSDASDTLKQWQDAGHVMQEPEQHKYMLAIQHDPDSFMDLSKPVSEQHPDVANNMNRAWNHVYGEDIPEHMTGQDVHNTMFNDLATDAGHKYPEEMPMEDQIKIHKQVADTLGQADLPGVKYLDNLSEEGTAPRKTYNYVTYSDAIKVLKKYGMAGLGAVGLGNLMMNHPNITKHKVDEEQYD